MFSNYDIILKLTIAFLTLIVIVFSFTEKIKVLRNSTKDDLDERESKPPKYLRKGDLERDFGDLPIVLLFSVVFSLFASDAILPVTSLTIVDQSYLFSATIIIALISLLSILSWYFAIHITAMFYLGIGTILLVAVSSIDYLNVTEKYSTNMGASLLIKMAILIILVFALFLHLKKTNLVGALLNKKNLRSFLSLLLPLIFIMVLASMVVQKLVFLDENMPPRLDGNTSVLLAKVENSEETENLYRILSEIGLHDFYYKKYMELRPRFLELGKSYSELKYPTDQINRNNRNQQNKENYSYSQSDRYALYNQDNQYLETGNTIDLKKFEYYKFLYEIINEFNDRRNPINRFNHLSNRLLWIHPIGESNSLKTSLNIPGLTPSQRYLNLFNQRNAYILKDKIEIRERTTGVFSYPQELNIALGDKEKKTFNFENFFDGFANPQKRLIFFTPEAKDGSTDFSETLFKQAAVPMTEETFLGYFQYLSIATDIAAQQNSKIGEYIKIYNTLSTEVQDGFKFYLISGREKVERSDRIRALASISKIDFSEITNKITNPYPFNIVGKAISGEEQIDSTEINVLSEENRKYLLLKKEEIIKNTANGDRNRKILSELMLITGMDVDIINLFNFDLLKLINKIEANLTNGDQDILFALIENPVLFVFQNSQYDFCENKELLEEFVQLDLKQKNALLHHLASKLFRFEGEHALNPLKLIIYSTSKSSQELGIASSFVLLLPIILLFLFFGQSLAKIFSKRNRLLNTIGHEELRQKQGGLQSELAPLYGRNEESERIAHLSNSKNRFTIAITGRRGTGKSRLLREIYNKSIEKKTVVWMDCPSKYSQDDFIMAALENLAFSVEKDIANYLNISSVSIEKIKRERFADTFIIFCVLSTFIFIGLSQLYQPGSLLFWTLIFAVFIFSILTISFEYLKIKPIDVTNLLGTNEEAKYHTAMLYGKTREMLKFITSRQVKNTVSNPITTVKQVFRYLFLALFGIWVVAQLIGVLIIWYQGIYLYLLKTQVLQLLFMLLTWFLVYYLGKPLDKKDIGFSIITLINKYKEYASEVVFRQNRNALGTEKKGVLFCIDELDKITEDKELKDFVRNIKAIFDIEGVSYYLSISEDALQSFSMGSITGKNEFDSSFDHVLQIKPIPINSAMLVSRDYLCSQYNIELPELIVKSIAFLSFGLPRDVIRKCETFYSLGVLNKELSEILLVERLEKAEMALQSGIISYSDHRIMISEPIVASSHLKKEFLGKDNHFKGNEQRMSTLLYNLLILEVEKNTNLFKDQYFNLLNEIYDIGYSIPTQSISDLRQRFFDVLKEIEKIPVDDDPKSFERDEVKSKIVELLTEGDTNAALNEIEQLMDGNNELLVIKGNYKRILGDYHINVITYQEYMLEVAKISNALVSLIRNWDPTEDHSNFEN